MRLQQRFPEIFRAVRSTTLVLFLSVGAVSGVGGCSGSEGGGASQSDPELARLEQEMFRAINRYRDSIGLNRLEWNDAVAGQARLHSRNMAAGRVPLGHGGAEERTAEIGKVIRWASVSENVAYSTRRSDMISFLLARWLESSGHRKNIEGEFNLSGIGAAVSNDGRYFFTQIFVLTE